MCERCKDTGLVPFVKDGRVIPNAVVECECGCFMIPKRQKKTEQQELEGILDDLWSEAIRKLAMRREGGCERCHRPKEDYKRLQAAHCFGRGERTVRWDIRNGAGCCGACHMLIDRREDEKRALFTRILGEEEYRMLYILAHMTTKQAPVDYKATEIALRMLIKELDSCCTTIPS